ncbi:MAG TPA: hypothetical protein VFR16_11235 [Agromyces mariniharenae]|nr:hypothetical protein [Agromyces mariniharenae]
MTDPREHDPDRADLDADAGAGTDDEQPGPDADQLDADNAVEADSVETLDPDNPPA